jgi:hypothetical protein
MNKNPAQRKKHNARNKKYHDNDKRREYRRELAAARRKKGMMGKGGKDLHHTKSGKLVKKSVKANRGRK